MKTGVLLLSLLLCVPSAAMATEWSDNNFRYNEMERMRYEQERLDRQMREQAERMEQQERQMKQESERRRLAEQYGDSLRVY